MNYKYAIGCDPSVKNFGIALLNLKTSHLELFSGHFWDSLRWIGKKKINFSECIIYVEHPNASFVGDKDLKNSAIEAAKRFKVRAALSAFVMKLFASESFIKALGKIKRGSRNIGNVQATAKLIEDRFRMLNADVISINPASRQKAIDKIGILHVDLRQLRMPTKSSIQQFEKYCGYKGKSSEHSRDAATLILHKTQRQFENEFKLSEAKRLSK